MIQDSLRRINYITFILISVLMPIGASAQNWGRGPIQATDVFPIALGKLNYFPSTTKIINQGEVNLRSSLHWGNTINGIDKNYFVDAESREELLSARYGVDSGSEVGLHIPILWRGSGVLDSFIYDWHNFWGFPQGPRRETEQDRYLISGTNSDKTSFDFQEQGLKLGDLRLSAKRLLFSGDQINPAVSSEFLVSIPTGSYSNNGFDLLASMMASKNYGNTFIYLGSFISASQKTEYQNLDYKRYRYGGSINVEIALSKLSSIIFGLVYGSNYTSDISRFPNYQLYSDLGLKYQILENCEAEFLIRENPAPDRGSSDFSFLLALNSNFSFL